MIESWVGKLSASRLADLLASRPPATPVMNDASANAHSL